MATYMGHKTSELVSNSVTTRYSGINNQFTKLLTDPMVYLGFQAAEMAGDDYHSAARVHRGRQ